jgi:hypothetical protein
LRRFAFRGFRLESPRKSLDPEALPAKTTSLLNSDILKAQVRFGTEPCVFFPFSIFVFLHPRRSQQSRRFHNGPRRQGSAINGLCPPCDGCGPLHASSKPPEGFGRKNVY